MGGIPTWTFKLLRVILDLAPLDVYVLSPMVLLGVVGVALGAGLADLGTGPRVALVLAGVALLVAFVATLRWGRQMPAIPDEDDVASVSIARGVDWWPRAPNAPVAADLKAKGSSWFRDREGRRVILRGINLSGASKMPTQPNGATYLADGLNERENVSFVGRPFPLDEMDIHLGRLRAWGLTCIRLLVTWEAVEHAAPGQYDQEYLRYLVTVVRRCHDFGLSVFIDSHQDVWSRWTGGDGAPAWTLEKVGFDLDALDASGAAVTHQRFGDPFPKMVWNSNNGRLAAGTMWTLFFAGDDFAPATMVDGEPVQQYLQRHYCAALAEVARALRDEPNVLGFDVINEPSVGFVGVPDARDVSTNQFYVGWRVAPWTAMELGAGKTRTVDYFSSFLYYDGTRTLNETGAVAWKGGAEACVWRANGVWRDGDSGPELLKPHHFARHPRTKKKIDFANDYAVPFYVRAAAAIREQMPEAIIFAEPVLDMSAPNQHEQLRLTDEQVGAGFVWAKHWYDGITLITKSFSKYLGFETVRMRPLIGTNLHRAHGRGIATFKKEAATMGTGGCPVLVGECGIPFDMDGKHAFRTGDFAECTLALETTMRALEHALVSSTLWNYTPGNTNERGDLWNDEDLSVFSRDQIEPAYRDNLHAGGRSLAAVIRPYALRTAGDPTHMSFEPYRADRRFVLRFKVDHTIISRETVLFVPQYHYPYGADVRIHGKGTYKIDWARQTMTYVHDPAARVHEITITKVSRANGEKTALDKASPTALPKMSVTEGSSDDPMPPLRHASSSFKGVLTRASSLRSSSLGLRGSGSSRGSGDSRSSPAGASSRDLEKGVSSSSLIEQEPEDGKLGSKVMPDEDEEEDDEDDEDDEEEKEGSLGR